VIAAARPVDSKIARRLPIIRRSDGPPHIGIDVIARKPHLAVCQCDIHAIGMVAAGCGMSLNG